MQNPEALIIAAFGMFLIVIGFKNGGDNLIAAALGRPYGKSTLK